MKRCLLAAAVLACVLVSALAAENSIDSSLIDSTESGVSQLRFPMICTEGGISLPYMPRVEAKSLPYMPSPVFEGNAEDFCTLLPESPLVILPELILPDIVFPEAPEILIPETIVPDILSPAERFEGIWQSVPGIRLMPGRAHFVLLHTE